jgi:hypothetical protein
MTDSQLEYVGLFQFADVLTLGLQGDHHQFFEFIQAPVDASTAFAFQHRFHDLSVLVSSGDGLLHFSGDRRHDDCLQLRT